jgi:cell wall-associated NlpC family hydrolase
MNKNKKLVSYVIAILIVSIVILKYFQNFIFQSQKQTDSKNLASHPTIPKDSIVNYGMKFLGTPYVTAGCSKEGFDCSGFVYFVFQHFNIKVPRS